MNSSTSFEDLITNIHEELGCSEMKLKPELQYQFDIQGAEAMKLTKKTHWDGLKEDLAS